MIQFVRVRETPDLREYLLDHGGLSQFPDRGLNGTVNGPYFIKDLVENRLDSYQGEFVAYHKGVLCGQSADGEDLYKTARNYFGASNLAVFRVPNNKETVENSLERALGEY